MSKWKSWLPFLILILIAALTRFYGYASWSLSNDELSALSRLRFDSFSQLIDKGVAVDGHPAGVQVLLYYWTMLFGDSTESVRLPFVIFGILSVALSYLIARRWFGKTPAFFAGLALALLNFPVLYSQLARPYISGMFFVLLAVYFWDKLLFRDKYPWRYAILTGIAFALAMYNHYFSFLAVFILGILGLFYARKNALRFYLVAGIIAVVLFVPHIPHTIQHLKMGGVGQWLAKPSASWIIHHLVYVFNDSTFLLFAVASIAIASMLYENKMPQWSRYHTISALLFGGVFITGFVYSHVVDAVLQHSVMIFVTPFLLFILFSGVRWNKLTSYLVYLLALFLVIPPYGLADFYGRQHFGEFEGIADRYVSWNKEYGSDQIANVLIANDQWYIQYYFDKDFVQFDYVFSGEKDELEKLASRLDQFSKKYVCFAWTKPMHSQAYDVVRSRYPVLLKDKRFGTLSRISLFAKGETESNSKSLNQKGVLFREAVDFDGSQTSWQFKNRFPVDTLSRSCYRVSRDKKYDLNFRMEIDTSCIHLRELEITADILARDTIRKSMLVMAISGPEGQKVWKGIPLSYFLGAQGQWHRVVFTPEIDSPLQLQDQLKVYLWNRGKDSFLVDNLSVLGYGY